MPNTTQENRLLSALSATERNRVLKYATEVTFDRGDIVYRRHEMMAYVFFPRTGLISMVIDMEDGRTIEVGTVGSEGMVGLPIMFGAEKSPTRTYCQVPPCTCDRIPAQWFENELKHCATLRRRINRYAQAHLNLAAQAIACNSLHPLEERLACWLLITHDRVRGDQLKFTQQVLSEMLGVRRASVTAAAGVLQKAGLIRYARGRITVLDRDGLEDVACECYAIVAEEFERLVKSEAQ